MANRKPKGSVADFTRGAEIWTHQARLFFVAILTVVVVSVALGLIAGVAYFYYTASPTAAYALERNLNGQLREFLFMTNGKMELYINGEKRKLEVKEVVAMTEDDARDGWRVVHNSEVIGGMVAGGSLLLMSLYWVGFGSAKMTDNRLRGAELVSSEGLRRMMKARDDCSPYDLAGVPVRKKAESLHFLIAGAQGVGKSQQFFHLMEQVRARGKRAIVYDPTGEYVSAFYREGKDIIMNPLDARSPNWNVWTEIHKDYHFDNLANGLIPDPAEADPFWAKAGRMVLKDVYRVLGREGKRTNKDLYDSIAKNNLDALYALLEGTAGATYVDPVTERTGMSLKMTVQNQLESFRFLHDEGELFSIRAWVQNESDTWMFITGREEQREALAPVLSLWIDTAIKAVLSLEPIHKERLWFFIDELPTLQKLDILKLALTNTRKYGLCCVLGVQDFSQLYEIYGHDLAKTIISGCQTKLLLRVTDGAAAKLLAEGMGQTEIDEKEENLSFGVNSQRDGVNITARRSLRDIVLSSEVLTLPDMAGFIQTPGDYPIARVQYDYKPREKHAVGFTERAGFGVDFMFAKKTVERDGKRIDIDSGEILDMGEAPDSAASDGKKSPLADAL